MTVCYDQRPLRVSGGEEAGRFLTTVLPGRRWAIPVVVCSGLSGGGDRTEFRFGGGDTREEVGAAAVLMDRCTGEAGCGPTRCAIQGRRRRV